MNIKKLLIAFLCICLLQNYLCAQDKSNIKFGKIAPEDFDLSKNKFDSGASAVIIADIGNTSFEGNIKGYFTLVFKRFRRVKIINKNGFDVATESINLYSDGTDEEKLADLKASTYNLENGKITETRLEDKSIFTDKIDRHNVKKKFALPAVKEGSIIEISYTIKSDFYTNLQPWNFQGEYPCLWSEYLVTVPQFFHYVVLTQGDQSFAVKTTKTVKAYYSVRESGGASSSDNIYSISGSADESHWVMKDVPPLKRESYTTTIRNHVSRVEFQLHYTQFGETAERHDYMGNWFMASEKLLNDEHFGKALDEDNHWMSEDMKTITAGCHDDLEKMKKIYVFVRDNFTCTNNEVILAENSLKTVFKKKSGSVAEINLLLTAMLRHENISADPVLLSTRENGYASETYPLIERFNYVVCSAKTNDRAYYLDASDPIIGFGHLPNECYNGTARTINKEKPYAVFFDADSLNEQKSTSVIIINDDKGHPSGNFQSVLGYYESYDTREKIKKKSEKDFFKDIQSGYGGDIVLQNPVIDSLTKLEFPIKLSYDFDIKNADEDIIYFNPMMSEGYKENPFKSAERKYPVEMPYRFDETYNLSMEIPAGYVVEELPKSAKVAYNEKEGFFEYLIQKDETSIQMRSRIKLNKAFFSPDEYNTLRDFFAFIVKKQSEQVVFKKKK
ncbi:MAG TPA: DUF3858 domain-containing protein [Puia sp.]|nr:DUF3858 domain-containing protein [Puia sp.]